MLTDIHGCLHYSFPSAQNKFDENERYIKEEGQTFNDTITDRYYLLPW